MARRLGSVNRPGLGFRGLGGSTGGGADPYSPAASAIVLPASAVWISQQGVTTADSGTTADSWLSYLGGIASTLTAPAATNRPAYSASGGVGGRPLLTFDGTDNVLTGAMTKGSAFANYEWGIVGSRVSFGTANDVWFGYTISGSPVFYLNDQTADLGRVTVAGGANVSLTGTDPDVTIAHYSGDAASGTINARVNGAVAATASATVTSRADGGGVTLGAIPAGSQASNIAVQACYMGPALTADQRTYLRALLTHYTGVAS